MRNFTAACLTVVALSALSGHLAGQEEACAGRCGYCAEGQCVPARQTYGYYQTQWRRWPVAAPAYQGMKRRSQPVDPTLGPAVDPPAPAFESDVNPISPETRRRRVPAKSPSGERLPELPGVEPPPAEGNDPFQVDLGEKKGVPGAVPAAQRLPRSPATTGARVSTPPSHRSVTTFYNPLRRRPVTAQPTAVSPALGLAASPPTPRIPANVAVATATVPATAQVPADALFWSGGTPVMEATQTRREVQPVSAVAVPQRNPLRP